MIEFAKITRTSNGKNVRTVLAQVRMFGSEGDDENAETIDDCESIQPLGLVAHPVLDADTEGAVVRDEDEVHVLAIVHKTGALHDAETGETQLYGTKEPACRIRLRANGDIEIIPKSGQKVYVGAANGAGGMEPVGLGQSIQDQLDALKTYLDGHSHFAGTLTAPNGAVAGQTTAPAASSPSPPNVRASNANVK